MASPLGQPIVDIEHPGCVKDVASWLECLWDFGRRSEVEQRRKSEPHFPPFISHVGTTTAAAYLTRQNSLGLVQPAVEEPEVMEACAKFDVILVEYSGPLHRRAVQLLANDAVTNFGVDRIGADIIPNRPAVAACAVADLEIRDIGPCKKFLEIIHVFFPLRQRKFCYTRACLA